MTSIKDILGEPYITLSGNPVPEYALPVIKAYHSVLPLGKQVTSYKTPITVEVAIETVVALGETLKKLNNEKATNDLKLLPPEQYRILSKFSSTLPQLPNPNIIQGSTLYQEQTQLLTKFAAGVWLMVRKAFELPHFDKNTKFYEEEFHYEYNVIASKHKTPISTRVTQIVLTMMIFGLVTMGISVTLHYTINDGTLQLILVLLSLFLSISSFFSINTLFYKIMAYRKRKYYQEYFKAGESRAQQELQSYILQTQN